MNKELLKNNYLILPGFIPIEEAKRVAVEFEEEDKIYMFSDDDQVPGSPARYNLVGALEILCDKTPDVSKAIGEYVLPTYCYGRIYKKGATLKKHMDRPACEISLTLNLDQDTSWPISVETSEYESVPVDLNPGDAMMYLGTTALHWRDEFLGERYIQYFLHYVRSRGVCQSEYFDKHKTDNDIVRTTEYRQKLIEEYNALR